MDDTDWSFPLQIVKEDTVTLALKKHDGMQSFLRTEIRGYEEGSRFIVVFRLGSSKGPIRYALFLIPSLTDLTSLQLFGVLLCVADFFCNVWNDI